MTFKELVVLNSFEYLEEDEATDEAEAPVAEGEAVVEGEGDELAATAEADAAGVIADPAAEDEVEEDVDDDVA